MRPGWPTTHSMMYAATSNPNPKWKLPRIFCFSEPRRITISAHQQTSAAKRRDGKNLYAEMMRPGTTIRGGSPKPVATQANSKTEAPRLTLSRVEISGCMFISGARPTLRLSDRLRRAQPWRPVLTGGSMEPMVGCLPNWSDTSARRCRPSGAD